MGGAGGPGDAGCCAEPVYLAFSKAEQEHLQKKTTCERPGVVENWDISWDLPRMECLYTVSTLELYSTLTNTMLLYSYDSVSCG